MIAWTAWPTWPGWEARFAALKVLLAAAYVRATDAMAAPAVALQDAKCQEMAVTAEVACVLTVGAGTAGAFLGDCLALTNRLPLTLKALQAGTISWAHARAMVDETANLDPAGAAALEAHFLDPDAPNPARGCPAGDLVPYRFRSKVRTWRERHHPDSIEKRHTKSAKDRRVEFRPDSDGMAWFSAYLPADTAAGIWDRTTAAARALQGPDEPRTLTQLRADVAATLLLNTGTDARRTHGHAGDVPVPRAQVLITVPVLSLLGATEEPAMLDGYGPIPPSMARRLVADGADSFHRVLVDPGRGAAGNRRTSYRLRRLCAWLSSATAVPVPGLQQPVPGQRRDHLLAWADGGTTGITNLGQPAASTTASNTIQPGHRPGPAKTNHPAGPPPPDGTIPANNRTGNHPTGHPASCIRSRTRTETRKWMQPRTAACPRTPVQTPAQIQNRNRNCPRTPSRTGTSSRPGTPSVQPAQTTWSAMSRSANPPWKPSLPNTLDHGSARSGEALCRLPRGLRRRG